MLHGSALNASKNIWNLNILGNLTSKSGNIVFDSLSSRFSPRSENIVSSKDIKFPLLRKVLIGQLEESEKKVIL